MKKLTDRILYNGNWLIFQERTLLNKHGQEVRWEMVSRSGGHSVGVVVMARLLPSNKYILIRQYRPAIEGYVIAFVAGIAVNGDIQAEALRELKEETGYYGDVVNVSPVLKSSAGILNEDCHFVSVDIDEFDLSNQDPVQDLEHAEDIEVIKLYKKDIPNFLTEASARGDAVASGLWSFFCMER